MVTVALVASSLGSAGVAVGSATSDRDPGETIASCTTITESGRYELTRDLRNVSQTCIEIRADEVVLDGAGHLVEGTDSPFARRSAVRVTDAADVRVTNLSVRDWGFAGVYLRGVNDTRVSNVTATRSRFGITVRTSERVRITNATATNNSAAGIDLSTTGQSVVADSVASANPVGISLSVASTRNRVVRNVVRDNRYGVVVSNSDDNEVVNNTLCGNQNAVVRLERPQGNTFEGNQAC